MRLDADLEQEQQTVSQQQQEKLRLQRVISGAAERLGQLQERLLEERAQYNDYVLAEETLRARLEQTSAQIADLTRASQSQQNPAEVRAEIARLETVLDEQNRAQAGLYARL